MGARIVRATHLIRARLYQGVSAGLVGLLICTPVVAAPAETRVQAFVYQPQFFADVKLGPTLPTDTSILRSYLWYVRMDESARVLTGMDRLRRLAIGHDIPGFDFSQHRTLMSQDLERLLAVSGKSQLPPQRLLRLAGTAVDDRAMPIIGRQYDLEVLDLSERISDQGLSFIRGLKKLRSLALNGKTISDQGAENLVGLPHLNRLSFANTQVTDAGLQKLRRDSLRQLAFSEKMTDRGLAIIQSQRNLNYLDLHAARVTRQGLERLSALPALHTLFLGSSIRDIEIPALARIPHLSRLDLSGAAITDGSLPTLAALSTVEELALNDTQISEKALDALRSLPRLRYLDLSRTAVKAEHFRNMTGFETLQVISFTTDRPLKIHDIDALGRLPQLHTILINGHPIGRAMVRFLQSRQLKRSEWRQRWVALAYAAEVGEGDVEEALKVASAPEDTDQEKRAPFRGLKQIHAAESSLDEIITAPPTIGRDNQDYDEKNFMGEFVIEGDHVRVKKAS